MPESNANHHILPDTALAAANHNATVNTYHQLPNKQIIERRWNTSGGTFRDRDIRERDANIRARIFTPLAASFESEEEEFHLYYIDESETLQEIYRSGNEWQRGKLGELKISPYYSSRLAVAILDERPHIFYQASNQWIQEVVRNDKASNSSWTRQNRDLGAYNPLWRTSLTAVTVEKKILVYYQKDDPILHQLTAFSDKSSAIPISTSWHTPLSAITESGTTVLFYTDFNNNVQEVVIHEVSASRAFYRGDTNPKGQIAAVAWKDGKSLVMRVFWQNKTTNEIDIHVFDITLDQVVQRAKEEERVTLIEEQTMKKPDWEE